MTESNSENTSSFCDMGLDERILKAISDLGWDSPTLIQEKSIPLALKGNDVLARARTGSGKTAAFVIPVVQKILSFKKTATEQCIKALVLAPTKELSQQAQTHIQKLCAYCSREVRSVDISGQVPLSAQKPLLLENPDILVATPSRVLAHIHTGTLNLKHSIEFLVVDEADLLFSFGYDSDMQELLKHLPKVYQAILMSATLSEDVKILKQMVLHNPVILKLEEPQLPETNCLTQYQIKCEEEDKFLLLYALIKLNLIRGKTIIFVKSVNRCYKLKLYLEQFSIPACALNSELPINSRCHIVNQFNEGLYDIIIASDATILTEDLPKSTQKHKRLKKDKQESGIARGIDFHHVSNVINFDFPTSVDAYVHRVGRTARGDKQGTALSFVNHTELKLLEAVETQFAGTYLNGDTVFKPYQFKMDEIDGFRYRAKGAMRKITKIAIRDARLKEIKMEILNSNKLKSYFKDNPRDLELLRHDKASHSVQIEPHLKDVPDYLVPPKLKHVYSNKSSKRNTRQKREKYMKKKPTIAAKKFKNAKTDPLKTFQFTGMTKKRKRK